MLIFAVQDAVEMNKENFRVISKHSENLRLNKNSAGKWTKFV